MIIELIGYKNAILGWLFVFYIAQTHLNIRQLEKLLDLKRPKTIKSFVNAKDFETTRVKKVEDLKVMLIINIYVLVQNFALLKFNFHSKTWKLSGYLASLLIGESKYDEIFNSIVFFIIYKFIMNILDIGLYYIQYKMLKESRYSDKTFTNYISDLKFLSRVKAIPGFFIFEILVVIIDRMGTNYFYYLCLLILAIVVIYNIKTTFFMDLSSKDYELLQDGELKNELESLAERIKFPLDKIFLTSHDLTDPKAKCTSIGFIAENLNGKSIVLYKDAIRRNSVEEACALVSSKLAHSKLDFNLKEFALKGCVGLYCTYIFITLLYNQRFANEFGFGKIPIIVYFNLCAYIISYTFFTLDFLSNLVKRRHTIEADSVAKSLGYKKQLKLGIIKLNEESSSYFNSDQWYIAYYFSELTVVERLIALKKSKRRKID